MSDPRDAVERAWRDDGPRLWRSDEAVATPDRWIWRTAFRIAAGELKERRRVPRSRGSGIRGHAATASGLLEAVMAAMAATI